MTDLADGTRNRVPSCSMTNTTRKAQPVEGTDYQTYQPGNRQSGWNWYCLHCSKGRGWRWKRADARKDARTHNTTCEEAA